MTDTTNQTADSPSTQPQADAAEAPQTREQQAPEPQAPGSQPPGLAASESVSPATSPSDSQSAPSASSDDDADKPKIQIGSRRGAEGEKITSSKPQMTADKKKPLSLPPEPRRGKVKPPSVRDPLPDDLERELAAALGDASLDDLVSGVSGAETGDLLEVDSRYHARIVRLHGDNVFFALDGRNEGVVSLRQFDEEPEIGSVMEVVVTGFSEEDGLYELRAPGASVEVHDWSDVTEGTTVEATVTGSNTGGLECTVGSIRGFIPASQVSMYRVEDFSDYTDQKLLCVVTEANERRRNLVLSHRAYLEREREAERARLLAEIKEGDVREGTVSRLLDFGAFVDLGGLDGLIHISQLSWDRVKHPSEVLQEGQKVRVKVEKVDPQTGKIGLSYRDLLEQPWQKAELDYPVDSVVRGTVSRIANFGAFVKLGPGVEGLIHVSELAHHRVVNVGNVVKEGEEVTVKVLSIDPEAQRISLSLKAAQAAPQPAEGDKADEEEEPARQAVVPKRQGPLKGGTNRPTGGEEFGLRW